ncbi:hypothetical protein EW145_g3666 [Phellinidium pouzarii]|uniref:Small ribosomal subunit protein uS7 domain-containing protein n=1 Tax=Phellinidium pouzarii TaxID=167371 RepID=A0A4S4L693_9AGAM|nr:hypothetical protein EW145_g3666 [Phellinidium pouzarii]
MATVSTLPFAVSSLHSEIKLFGKWETQDVEVKDISLTDYIQIRHAVYLPHTAGRYAKKQFKKAQMPVVERLVDSLMMKGRNNGKKLMAVRIVAHAFEIIHLLTDQNPIQVLVDAIVNTGPREDSTRIGSQGTVRRQAVDVSPLRRVNQAVALLTIGTRESAFRNVKSIAECLAEELINAAKGSSNSYAIKSRFAIVSSAAILLGSVGLAQALSLSQGCQSTLVNLALSSEASCLNVAGLAPLVTASSNTSLVGPVNNWLAGACAQDLCSNQSLSDIVTNITSGCSSDLSPLGFSNSSTPDVISVVQQGYPTVREIACLKETSNNTLCVTDLLTDLQNEDGTLSLNTIFATLPQLVVGGASDVPSYIKCSDCVKQAYNVLKTNDPSIASQSNVTSALTSQCGASFLDGTTPSDVAEGTGAAAPTASSASAASSAGVFVSREALAGVALSSLAAVFSVFFTLA